jgi:hypothetical protein
MHGVAGQQTVEQRVEPLGRGGRIRAGELARLDAVADDPFERVEPGALSS